MEYVSKFICFKCSRKKIEVSNPLSQPLVRKDNIIERRECKYLNTFFIEPILCFSPRQIINTLWLQKNYENFFTKIQRSEI